MHSKLHIWVLSSRPKTLFAAVAPVLVGTALAYGDGALHIPSFIVILLAALAIQIGTNFANDYYDFVKGADTSERKGPVRAVQSGLASPNAMRNAFVLAFLIAAMLGLYLVHRGGLPILLIGILSIISGVLYTGGPFPLGYLGLGDIFVMAFFGPVAVGGTYYLHTLSINGGVLFAGLAPGALATAILVVNNIRDEETDRAAGKRTLVVRFGRRFGTAEYIFLIMLAFAVPPVLSVLTGAHYFCLLSFLAAFKAFPLTGRMAARPDSERLNRMLAGTGVLLILHSVLFSAGWLI